MNKYQILETTFQDQLQNIKQIRQQVFIEEQHVPIELEWDGLDDEAIHLIVFNNQLPIATSRLLKDGHIGRMAVMPKWRNQGVGTAMLLKLIKIAHQHDLKKVFLSSQVTAIDFYTKQGFNITSDTYLDAGIPHKDMQLNLME